MLRRISEAFSQAYRGRYVRWQGPPEERVHLGDAKQFLQAEIEASYELLSGQLDVLVTHASPALARAIREASIDEGVSTAMDHSLIAQLRQAFFLDLHRLHGHVSPCSESVTDALAWAVVVEMALLSDQLTRDMALSAQLKGCHFFSEYSTPRFYLPATANTPDSPYQADFVAASAAFREYVRCRWPIHVFALDPVTQDQNVADVANRRRELQLAASLAFATGEIGINNLTQFNRNLEYNLETIALNRTAIGFAHANDTFGWRFLPRIQTPPPPGNLRAFGETLFGGPSRDWDLGQRELEAGIRECIAIVLMPSFVPYCDFDVRTNWFRLSNPGETEISMAETMRLSQAVTSIRGFAMECVNDAHLYRENDLRLLLRRVDQLDRELALQTMRVQIPFENTLGGFEMFNTGVTDLAPELVGWYGAPGVRIDGEDCTAGCNAGCPDGDTKTEVTDTLAICHGEGTTLFLVGDNLSVHDTRIIAGGVCIPHTWLVSREIIQVTIPKCVNRVQIDGHEYVDVHAATPYGVTNHLHLPVIPKAKPTPKAPILGFATADADRNGIAHLCFRPGTGGVARFAITKFPTELLVQDPDTPKFGELYPTVGRLAFQVNAVDADGTSTRLDGFQAGNIIFNPGNGVGRVGDLSMIANQIQRIVEARLKVHHKAVGLDVAAFLTYEQPTGKPVQRLSNSLQITLNVDDCQACPTPAVPATFSSETPAAASWQ